VFIVANRVEQVVAFVRISEGNNARWDFNIPQCRIEHRGVPVSLVGHDDVGKSIPLIISERTYGEPGQTIRDTQGDNILPIRGLNVLITPSMPGLLIHRILEELKLYGCMDGGALSI
jgi:hypothetical protein